MLRSFVPVTKQFHEAKFFIIENGKRFATPMLAVLLALETTDIIFAVDSIPAVLAISTDPFIVYTSKRICHFRIAFAFFRYFPFDEIGFIFCTMVWRQS